MLNYKEKASQSDTDILSHVSQNGSHQERKQVILILSLDMTGFQSIENVFPS
jgi:hypothetical protein